MEKFMLIFKGGFYEDANLSPEGAQKHMEKWYSWVQQLADSKNYLSGEPLLKTCKYVKKKDKKVMVTDGPFPESKELVAGYFILNAKSIEEATEIAKGYPDFDLGGKVEVRQIRKIEM